MVLQAVIVGVERCFKVPEELNLNLKKKKNRNGATIGGWLSTLENQSVCSFRVRSIHFYSYHIDGKKA